MSQLQSHSALPELRPELQFKPGIRELDGSKSWLIFDPLRHEYFQINTKNLKILGLWGRATAGEIVERLYEYSVTLDDIESLLRFLWKNSLTVQPPNENNDFYLVQSAAKRGSPLKLSLIHI